MNPLSQQKNSSKKSNLSIMIYNGGLKRVSKYDLVLHIFQESLVLPGYHDHTSNINRWKAKLASDIDVIKRSFL